MAVKKFVALIIACAGFGAMFAPATARLKQSDEKQQVVKISGQTIRIRQCIEPVDGNRQREVSELLYGQRITNISGRPIVIYRYPPKAYDVRLSTALEGIEKAKFKSEKRPTFANTPAHFIDPDSPNKPYGVLQPGQSFNYEYPEALTFLPVELINTDKKILVGEFFIQLKVATWLGTPQDAEKVQRRWSQYGEFFYQDVITEPFPFTIEKVGATTPRCDTQPK